HFEAGQPRHLDVEHDQIGLIFLYYAQRLHTVSRLRDDLHAADLLEQEAQLVAGELLVVDDDGAKGVGLRRRRHAVILAGTDTSGITMRAQVPSPGTLSS